MTAKGSFYRIRIGDYRIGIIVTGDVVSFIRVLHRKDMYRSFS
ncbi:MAG: type II toxin-antitoxin system RelE/ParE family toxin [Cyanobacteria bacterium P01_F01_bin.150]